jgi:hydroxymethylglutaryl-CoA synthase
MQRAFGIDSIGVYVPRLYVDLTGEWARVRAPVLSEGDVSKLVGKVTDGVGVRRMAVVDAHQDCATLAAMAAKRAIDAAGIDPRDIDYLAVGTETTVDQSKSAAAYVLGMLERHYGVSLAHVGAPQFQFACIGATYALEAAVSRLRAGDNTKPYAMVIASDISKYPLATAGEYTQGAGAVALLLSENPRLVELEQGLTGTVTRDERDFFRPNWSAAAVVDGKYSIDVYLDCMEAAFAAYAERAEARFAGRPLAEAIDHYLFHVPFPRMAEYAAARVLTGVWAKHPATRDKLAAQVPLWAAGPGGGDARAWRKEVERAVAKSALFRTTFGRAIEPTLTLSRDVGNMYSWSLYLALASLLEHADGADGASLAGRRLLFGSYGSGASAKVLSGVVSDRYESVARHLHVRRDLLSEDDGGPRVPLAIADYERLHGLSDAELECGDGVAQKLRDGVPLGSPDVAALRDAWLHPTWRVRARGASVRAPKAEFALSHLGTASSAQRTDTGYRYYVWVP